MVDVKIFRILEKLSEKETRTIKRKGLYTSVVYVLRNNLTADELELARQADAVYFDDEGRHIVANFLPDDERPADVPAR